MNYSIKQFGKGMLAIFTLKLLLFGGAFVIQSCQTDSIGSYTSIEQELALSKFESLVRTSVPKIRRMAEKHNNLLLSRSTNNESKTRTEEEAKQVLRPLIQGSKELFSAYGISESDFVEELDSEDPRIAMLGLALLSAKTNKEVAVNLSGLFVSSLYAQDAYDCALRAVGIEAVVELFNGQVTSAIAKRAIRKIASRALGWVGAAWAVYEFGDCMGWY